MTTSDVFEKTNNVLPSLVPYYQWDGFAGRENISSINNIFADLNLDGFADFIFHFTAGQNQENQGAVIVGPSPNRLVVLLSDGIGGYFDGNGTLFSSEEPVVFEGGSRKVVIGDLNNDNFPDVLYAVNREDGRSGQPSSTNASFSAVLMSQPNGQYQYIKVGVENWYHSAGIINGSSGPEIWLGGYHTSSGIIYRDAATNLASGFGYFFDTVENGFSSVIQVPAAKNTFTPIPNKNNPSLTQQVVATVDASGTSALGLFFKDESSDWNIVSSYLPIQTRVTVPFVSHSGNEGTSTLSSIDGIPITGYGHSASGTMELFPNSSPVAIFKANGVIIRSPREDGAYYENDGQAFSTFEFYSTADNVLTPLSISILGEDQQKNINFFECIDLTNDNLLDIIAYPYSNTGMPIVYVNTGAGVFAKLSDQKLPQADNNWGNQASSKFFDYNDDGIMDLIVGPMNGISIESWVDPMNQEWHLYQGTSHLSMDDYSDAITINDRIESSIIKTWAGDDIIFDLNANPNSTEINAGDGIDTIIYSLSVVNYSATEIGKSIVVTPIDSSNGGADTLISIETLQFSDGVAQLTDLIRPIDIDRGIYRFFNIDTGTHFLSGSTVERDSVINNLDSFNFEGPTFKAADPTNPAADTVFRFFNTQTGTHFFTQSTVERDNILDTIPEFSFEGEAYKGYTEQVDGSIPLYRFFNTQTGTHFYTAAEAEKDSIIENLPTFNFEGTAYWVDPVMG
jgi:hypothetical protein